MRLLERRGRSEVQNKLPVTVYFYPLLTDSIVAQSKVVDFLDSLTIDNLNESILYVHIPFCVSHCSFCPFNTMPVPSESVVRQYIDAILTEATKYSSLVSKLSF